jgi:hypothetical protein
MSNRLSPKRQSASEGCGDSFRVRLNRRRTNLRNAQEPVTASFEDLSLDMIGSNGA